MKLLLDSCVWAGARTELAAAGHDVAWAGDWLEDPGDPASLATAFRESRVLVTLDKDFGELSIVHGMSHAGIVRLVGFRAREQASAVQQVLVLHSEEVMRGALVTVRPGQLRLRMPQK